MAPAQRPAWIDVLSMAALLATGSASAAGSDARISWTYLEGGYVTADGNDFGNTDGWTLGGSLGFLDHWHVGASYTSTSSSSDSFAQDFDTDSWTASVGFHTRLSQNSQAYFDIGYFNVSPDDTSFISGDGDADGFLLLPGFRYQPTPKVELGAAVAYRNGSIDPNDNSGSLNFNDTSAVLSGQYFFIPAWSVGAKAELNLGGGSASSSSSGSDVLTVFTRYSFGRHVAAPAPVAAAVVAAPVMVKAAPPPPAPKDSDGDGVVDGTDQCPETPKGDRVGARGCSCDVSRQVNFKTNAAELTTEGEAVVDEMAETLTRLQFVAGTIEGHTDSTGSEAYNQGLSERRAKTVSDRLQAKGIAQGRMSVVGMGEGQPVGDNKTREGRAENRRVVAKRTDCDAK